MPLVVVRYDVEEGGRGRESGKGHGKERGGRGDGGIYDDLTASGVWPSQRGIHFHCANQRMPQLPAPFLVKARADK